eukprot:1285938-Rhodomonas_salina.2
MLTILESVRGLLGVLVYCSEPLVLSVERGTAVVYGAFVRGRLVSATTTAALTPLIAERLEAQSEQGQVIVDAVA